MAEKKPVKITETVLRDAHQSLIATRMTTEQMLPIIDKMDKVGYHSVECWGGATFDACLRFLKEDPWERLRKLRDGFKNTKLQMLFRGQNILGYNHYADDVVEYFVQKSIANGIDIIRIFDCLNDIRNLETAVKATKKEGGHAQIALCYTLGDAYTLDYWKNIASEIESMGADSLCIKDMAGLLTPYAASELVTALKQGTKLPIDLHTHYTSGVASMTYLKAVEAGCDIIDCAMSPLALGTSQPATEVMVETFKGTPYDTGFDQKLLSEIADYIADAVEKRSANGNNFGVAIIPEGVVEFVPEFKALIAEINELLAGNKTEEFNALGSWEEKYAFIEKGLTAESMAVFAILPQTIQQQLFLERDPHGNVQVSLIESEKLFSALVKDKLTERGFTGKFNALHHFFGYEGRCAFPSNFDADYCYSLGYNAFMLIQYGYTGYLSKVSNLAKPAEEWVAGGMPITKMMNMERRNGEDKPVIKKALVELDGKPFKYFEAHRDQWAVETAYTYPGAIQYYGPAEVCDLTTRTLALEKGE